MSSKRHLADSVCSRSGVGAIERSPDELSDWKADWLAENFAALESSNAYVEAHGLPLQEHRNF